MIKKVRKEAPYALVPLSEAFASYEGGAKAFLLEHGDFVNDEKNCYAAVITEDFISEINGSHDYDSLFGAEINLPEDAYLSAIYFKKNLSIPNACYLDYDSDFSPSLIVDGNVTARALSLSGGNTLIKGDCTVSEIIYGFYNHGELVVNGATSAPLIIANDYSIELNGAVNADYMMGSAWKTLAPKAKLPIWDVTEHKKEIKSVMDTFFMNEYGFDADLIHIAVMVGDCVLKNKPAKAKKRKKSNYYQLSDSVKEKLADYKQQQDNSLPVTVINLNGQDMGELPAQFKQFKAVKNLNLTNNGIKKLPDWFGDLNELRHLNLRGNYIKNFKLSPQQQANIESLNISDNLILRIQDELKPLPKLTELWLGKEDHIGDEEWGKLAFNFDWSRTPNLQHLHINETGWFWPWDNDFEFYRQCPNLKYLHFGYLAKGAMGKHLAQLKQLEFYGYETCWNSQDEHIGELDFDTLLALPHLAVLYVTKSGKGFDKDVIQTLRQRLPHVYISAPYADAGFAQDKAFEEINEAFKKIQNYQYFVLENEDNVKKMLAMVLQHRLEISPKWFDKTWANILEHLDAKAGNCIDLEAKHVYIKEFLDVATLVKPYIPKTASWTHLMSYGYDLWESVQRAEIWYALRRPDQTAEHLAWAQAQLDICLPIEQKQGYRHIFAGLQELADTLIQ
jgi:Leucine rich repeat